MGRTYSGGKKGRNLKLGACPIGCYDGRTSLEEKNLS